MGLDSTVRKSYKTNNFLTLDRTNPTAPNTNTQEEIDIDMVHFSSWDNPVAVREILASVQFNAKQADTGQSTGDVIPSTILFEKRGKRTLQK